MSTRLGTLWRTFMDPREGLDSFPHAGFGRLSGECYDSTMAQRAGAIAWGAAALLSLATGCSDTSEGGAAADDAAAAPTPDVQRITAPEAAGPIVCTDANLQLILASNYNQSCTVNAECAAVGEGNACSPCTANCYNAAINFQAVPQYLSDVARTPAGSQTAATCNCPATFPPCCRGGVCYADLACQESLESDAATDAGIDGAAEGGASDASADAAPDGGPSDAGGG
jgi:hypothetical protein